VKKKKKTKNQRNNDRPNLFSVHLVKQKQSTNNKQQINEKMPRLQKGSEETRQRMAHLRSLRKKKGGSIEPVTPMMDPPVAPKDPDSPKKPEMSGKGSKTAWVKHVADYAHKNNMNYFEALKDPKVKDGYTKK
jgi:hypothetical protein